MNVVLHLEPAEGAANDVHHDVHYMTAALSTEKLEDARRGSLQLIFNAP